MSSDHANSRRPFASKYSREMFRTSGSKGRERSRQKCKATRHRGETFFLEKVKEHDNFETNFSMHSNFRETIMTASIIHVRWWWELRSYYTRKFGDPCWSKVYTRRSSGTLATRQDNFTRFEGAFVCIMPNKWIKFPIERLLRLVLSFPFALKYI